MKTSNFALSEKRIKNSVQIYAQWKTVIYEVVRFPFRVSEQLSIINKKLLFHYRFLFLSHSLLNEQLQAIKTANLFFQMRATSLIVNGLPIESIKGHCILPPNSSTLKELKVFFGAKNNNLLKISNKKFSPFNSVVFLLSF